MTFDETKKILRTLHVAYPTTWKAFSNEEMMLLIELWMRILGKFSYEQVDRAIMTYIGQKHDFPPTAGHIMDIILQQNQIFMPVQDAFDLVKKAIANSGRNSREEFQKLPAICQRVVSSPDELRSLAFDETGRLENSYRKIFFDLYKKTIEEIKAGVDIPQQQNLLESSKENAKEETKNNYKSSPKRGQFLKLFLKEINK